CSGYAADVDGAAAPRRFARRAGTSRSWRGPRGARLACEASGVPGRGVSALGSNLQVLTREDPVLVLQRWVLGQQRAVPARDVLARRDRGEGVAALDEVVAGRGGRGGGCGRGGSGGLGRGRGAVAQRGGLAGGPGLAGADRPRPPALAREHPLGHDDLLLTAGLVGGARELRAAEGPPRRRRELEPAEEPVAGVDVPVAAA